ncbi:helical backbone metal receptor [Fodinibacter luteus]|uniref:Helical backbone metal receptor n=1 Tax=Fodinibacter luteus TaxID=552064 RepID=A0ABP8KHQ3_9MICO
MPRTLTDDLGHAVTLPTVVARVVSLVPSLTEALAASCPERLVGATDWCSHPADLDARGVARVRGTKNPDLAAVAALGPDLVVANKEENRELDVRRMRARGIPVWVTDIETVPQAVASIRRLLREVLALPSDPRWLVSAEEAWCGPVPPPSARVVVPVWRDPWMVVGRPTFTAELLARSGLEVATAGGSGRYPVVELDALDDPAIADLVLLPDEPYAFSETDGPASFRRLPTRLVSGRLMTWYGPSLVAARISLDRS